MLGSHILECIWLSAHAQHPAGAMHEHVACMMAGMLTPKTSGSVLPMSEKRGWHECKLCTNKQTSKTVHVHRQTATLCCTSLPRMHALVGLCFYAHQLNGLHTER
jgi:hypothetical protein